MTTKSSNDQAAFKTRLGAPKACPPATVSDGFKSDVSPDGLAATVLFDASFQVELKSGKGSPDAVVKTGVIQFPVSVPTPPDMNFRGVHALLRGFVNNAGGAVRVSILVELGGAGRVIEFPYGTPVNGDFKESLFSFEGFSLTPPPVDQKAQASVPLPPASHYTAVMVVTIQRRRFDDAGVVQIESLNIEIVDPAKTPTSG